MRNSIIKALLTFKRFNDDRLSVFATYVIGCMTGNVNFPTATALVTALITAYEDYGSALKKANTGNRMDIVLKNAKRLALTDALTDVVNLVNYVAQGSAEKISTSGLDYTKERPAPPPLTLPLVDISYASGGKFLLKLKTSSKYQGVVYQYAPDNDTLHELTDEPQWVTHPCSDLQCTIGNLPIGKKVLIRVGVWSARETVIYTEPVSRMVA